MKALERFPMKFPVFDEDDQDIRHRDFDQFVFGMATKKLMMSEHFQIHECYADIRHNSTKQTKLKLNTKF